MEPPKTVYQLNVTLKYINPPIWRRLLVSSSITLFELHEVLQRVMGWSNSHLHEFTKDKTHYQPPIPKADRLAVADRFAGIKYKDSQKVILSQVLKQDDSIDYLYDFGDGWEHEIILEEILPAERRQYPVCLAGARACPPENCGGIPDYEDIVEAMRNPKHLDRKQFLEWLGGPYDPEKFDLKLVNRALENI